MDAKQEQKKDKQCKALLDQENLGVIEGFIYFKEYQNNRNQRRLCILENMRDEALFQMHDTVTGGHLVRN